MHAMATIVANVSGQAARSQPGRRVRSIRATSPATMLRRAYGMARSVICPMRVRCSFIGWRSYLRVR
ncbi:hypothetical protein D5H75_33010 [Bailinhaonella thermotolerans]|uniref:Uncharacterized protein n=1 Tax=Bailinhaonella thermotolerans TaxID=1070861 RepID=A0A3A4AAX3_9ACTN|nr:hypothetical protein D5H75_33010 [Bailinhaonella thermotolerans]